MGRSRGGNTTKIHALVDRNGLPIELKLTAGQAHDGKSAEDNVSNAGSSVPPKSEGFTRVLGRP